MSVQRSDRWPGAIAGALVLAAGLFVIGGAQATQPQPEYQQASGGSPNVRNGGGFGCPPGMSWRVTASGVRCELGAPAPPVVVAPPAGCTAVAAYAWGAGCSAASFPAAAHGAVSAVTNGSPGYSGDASARCDNGAWVDVTTSCSAAPPTHCVSQLVGWGGVGRCAGTSPFLLHGESAVVLNTSGSAGLPSNRSRFTCNAGTLIGEPMAPGPLDAGATCQ